MKNILKTNKIQKATDKINKNKSKLSYVLRKAKIRKRETKITRKFYALGVGINFALNISNELICNIANIFIKNDMPTPAP